MSVVERVRNLYTEFGQRKAMGVPPASEKRPHYFLVRTFLAENDLLIIFNTKRCAYQCYFCQLPTKSSKALIPQHSIVAQFEYVVEEVKHTLSILDRVTLSNEGSVLDVETFPTEALLSIVEGINELRRVRNLVLETRLEFVDASTLMEIRRRAPKANLVILTGFETHDPYIRDHLLFKRESLVEFEMGLNRVAESAAELTAYVLYKPSPYMSDEAAFEEADKSIAYLTDECARRNIQLSIRLNPMYAASGSKWARIAHASSTYQPPRLTDVMKLAEQKKASGVQIYIGLSTEGLDDGSTYMAREDYSPSLIKQVKLFNDGKVEHFSGIG